MQQQPFINFTDHNLKPPTYLNVVRNPIDRFISLYYSCRYGTKTNPGPKDTCKSLPSYKFFMPVHQYLTSYEGRTMSYTDINYVSWICGKYKKCKAPITSPDKINEVYTLTKKMVLINYFAIGILERMDETLLLFEEIMPDIFKGASKVYVKEYIQESVENSKSLNGTKISDELRGYLEHNAFTYDMDLYRFIYAKFMIQYNKFVIEKERKKEARLERKMIKEQKEKEHEMKMKEDQLLELQKLQEKDIAEMQKNGGLGEIEVGMYQ